MRRRQGRDHIGGSEQQGIADELKRKLHLKASLYGWRSTGAGNLSSRADGRRSLLIIHRQKERIVKISNSKRCLGTGWPPPNNSRIIRYPSSSSVTTTLAASLTMPT